MRFLYLHGFASSPQSRKAQAFRSALPDLEIPALDAGDFEHLTISGQLMLIEDLLAGEPASLIGSSMGGYLAAFYASRHPEVAKLVLMAPAFGFAPRWKTKANLEVFHYGTGTMRRVHYGLIEDALSYPATPEFSQPALIFHGVRDEIVPVTHSREFASTHSNARLIELDSDHELLNMLDRIVAEAAVFLERPLY